MNDIAPVGIDITKGSISGYNNYASFDGRKATAYQEFSKATGNYIGLNRNRNTNPDSVPVKWSYKWISSAEITGDKSEVLGYENENSVERTGTGVFSSGTSSQNINYAKGNNIEVGLKLSITWEENVQMSLRRLKMGISSLLR